MIGALKAQSHFMFWHGFIWALRDVYMFLYCLIRACGFDVVLYEFYKMRTIPFRVVYKCVHDSWMNFI